MPSRLSKAVVKADISPRHIRERPFDSSHAHWLYRNSRPVTSSSVKIVYPAPIVFTEALSTAGDTCLRNFYVGSQHNGIQSRLTRKNALAIRINVSSSCALGRFSTAVVRTAKPRIANGKTTLSLPTERERRGNKLTSEQFRSVAFCLDRRA